MDLRNGGISSKQLYPFVLKELQVASKICSRCQQVFNPLQQQRKYCTRCKMSVKYVRMARRFTDVELRDAIIARGWVAMRVEAEEGRFSVAFHRPGDPVLYLVRHDARNGYVHLVCRGDDEGVMRLIPTCAAQCTGCLKCAIAAEFNGETSAEARLRRHEPRTAHRIYTKRKRTMQRAKKILPKGEFTTCNPTEVDVHSQLEDID